VVVCDAGGGTVVSDIAAGTFERVAKINQDLVSYLVESVDPLQLTKVGYVNGMWCAQRDAVRF
jgi:hypothetical protein